MSTNLVVEIAENTSAADWCTALVDQMTPIGFAPEQEPEGSVPARAVHIRDGDSEVVSWPCEDLAIAEGDRVLVRCALGGRRNRVHSCGLAIEFGADGALEGINIGFSVPEFASSYSEEWRDMVLRMAALVEGIDRLWNVSRAICLAESGKTWIEFRDGQWTTWPELSLDTTDDSLLEEMRSWSERDDVPVTRDRFTESFLISGPEARSEGVAILRHNPLNGAVLPVSLAEDEHYLRPSDESEARYRRMCWRATNGLTEITDSLVGECHEIPAVPVPSYWGHVGEKDRVRRLVAVYDSDPNFVLLVREYENGRTSPIVAGKRRS
jgi:hypothetical protein